MKLAIATPSRGSISLGQRGMLQKLGYMLAFQGHQLAEIGGERNRLAFKDSTVSGMLAHARAALLYDLAVSDADKTLWLDSDVHFDPRVVMWALSRSEDIIMWGYPTRIAFDVDYPPEQMISYARVVRAQPYRVWTISPLMRGPFLVWSPDHKFVELAQGGFGAVLTSNRFLRVMHESHGPHQLDADGKRLSWAFEPPREGAQRLSEDISFWRRARIAGYRIWCEPRTYVTNGQSGGRFMDEIRLRETQTPWMLAQSAYVV